MNILIYSKDFYPSIGGIETITDITCTGLTKLGCNVTLITKSLIDNPHYDSQNYNFRILRRPSKSEVIREYVKCDVFIHEATSLRMLYPLLFGKKLWICVHHQVDLPDNTNTKLKSICYRLCKNIAVSQTTATGYGLKSYEVIYNAFKPEAFTLINNDFSKRKDFCFIGRIIEMKGCAILIDAFIKYKSETGKDDRLFIIGKETEYSKSLQLNYKDSEYFNDIHFTGYLTNEEAAKLMNQCKCGVVPSIYMEGFGITTLENMSCGCVTIGSDGDGISEAMDSCGFLFKKGSTDSLFETMKKVSDLSPNECRKIYEKGQKRILYLSPENVCQRYLDFINKYL